MNKPNVVIVSVPGMIEEKDWDTLTKRANVAYIEKDTITSEELLELIKNKEYLMLNFDVIQHVPEDFYKAIKDRGMPLKAISTDMTGMSWANPQYAKQYGIPLMNIPNYSTISVAEFAMATLLIQVKKIHLVFEDKWKGGDVKPYKNDVLFEKTLGIVGLGHIGSYMAKLAQGFGMNTVSYNRTPKSQEGIQMVTLENLFTTSDYISLNLKTNQETEGIVSKRLLSLVKPGTIIVNLADGKLVNNDDMLKAIQSHRVGGYIAHDEAVKGHLLKNEQQVTTYPPQAWFTDHSLNVLKEIWVTNIMSAIEGNLQNVV